MVGKKFINTPLSIFISVSCRSVLLVLDFSVTMGIIRSGAFSQKNKKNPWKWQVFTIRDKSEPFFKKNLIETGLFFQLLASERGTRFYIVRNGKSRCIRWQVPSFKILLQAIRQGVPLPFLPIKKGPWSDHHEKSKETGIHVTSVSNQVGALLSHNMLMNEDSMMAWSVKV